MRVVIVVLVVAIIVWLLTARSRARARSGKAAGEPPQAESFARCAHCGVHLPLNEALVDHGVAFCSEAHRLAGPRDHDGS